MKHFHLLARPVAATAVVGIALIGLAGTAGAATVSVSLPPVLGNVGSSPVVTVGSGSVAPAPGADITVPVHGDDDVSVDNPTVTSTGPVAVPTGNGNLVSEHSSVDACVAAALLTGHSPTACGPTAGDLADSLSRVGTAPSLTESLSSVGACAKLALANGQPIDTCSPSSVTTAPTTAATAAVAAAVDRALAGNGLCDIGAQLGLSGLATCGATNAVKGSLGANASGTTSVDGTGVNAGDVCLGLAAVTHVDAAPCSHGSADVSADVQARNRTHAKAGRNGTVGAAAPSTTVLNATCASTVGNDGGSAPAKGEVAGGIAGLGFAAAGIGRRIRRMRRPVLA